MSGVDVLAVIAKHAQWKRIDGFHESHVELNDVRAAVAELIEAAKRAKYHVDQLRRHATATSHDVADYLAEVDSDKATLAAALALARVQGGAL